MKELRRLRSLAVARSLSGADTLQAAVDRLGFVQADPIRAPARAQDLILRHRAPGYRAGDLERRYPELDLEEDYLYAYGFVSRAVWRHLHPRRTAAPGALEKRILEAVRRLGEAHPAALEKDFGGRRVTNAWGGSSKATTEALEWLHYRGLLRVARREKGIRVYAAPAPLPEPLPPAERLENSVMAIAGILAPVPQRTLQALAAPLLRRHFPELGSAAQLVAGLVKKGALARVKAGGADYLLPPGAEAASEAPRRVSILAPFDPIVWDRRRFEHFWGWAYRFEAYTPPAKRVRGYYAMPLLWGDEVIGWANAALRDGCLEVETGYAGKKPGGADFRRELEAEIDRLRFFLNAPVLELFK